MKKDFDIETTLTWLTEYKGMQAGLRRKKPISKAHINGNGSNAHVHIAVCNQINTLADLFIKGVQLERFAVNILKALKSDKLK